MALAFDYETQELNEMDSMTSMPSQDLSDTNYFTSFDSINQSILETTMASDLACEGSDVSFHVTSPIDILCPSGMTPNTIQEIGVSNLEIPNLDEGISASSSANFRILGQQEKLDDVSSVDGLMASDFLFHLEYTYEVDHISALVDSMLEQDDTGNFNYVF